MTETVGRRQREAEELRRRILDAAERIMVREGVERVTMRRIAGEVEYAPTVLYRLFADKDDLMDHLIARGYAGVRERYEQALAGDDSDPAAVLAGILRAYVEYALEHPNHYRMWFATSSISVVGGRLRMRHGRQEFLVYQTWLDWIDRCRDAGHFPGQARLDVFQVLWARVHGLVSLRLQHPDFPWLPVEQGLRATLGH